MEKIFYTDKRAFGSSELAVKKVLSDFFGLKEPTISRSENGKPYLDNKNGTKIFFSVSHTEEKLFIAVSDENVGLDAEKNTRNVEYFPIVRKFPPTERLEIRTLSDFLRHWTAKESAVKWLGGSLAHDLYKLRFEKGSLFYGEIELPVCLRFFGIAEHVVAVCGERDFENADVIAF